MSKVVTIYDIAEEAGVSHNTVARILRGIKGRASNEEKVQKAAEKLGYVRHHQAAALRSGKSGFIGLILPRHDHPFHIDLFSSAQKHAAPLGYQILLASGFGGSVATNESLTLLESIGVDGIILITQDDPKVEEGIKDTLKRLKKRKIPIVKFGKPFKNIPTDTATISNRIGSVAAIDYLVKKGYRKIGFIGIKGKPGASEIRERGYRDALKKHKIIINEKWLTYQAESFEGGQSGTKQLLSLKSPPTAIFCANDFLAIGAILAAKELGVRIPEQLAILGFDDLGGHYTQSSPRLTSVHTPVDQLAEGCVNLIATRLANPSGRIPFKTLRYNPELALGESC